MTCRNYALENTECRQSSDDVKRDLELICTLCDDRLCDVQHGDTLHVLAMMAEDHWNEKHPDGE